MKLFQRIFITISIFLFFAHYSSANVLYVTNTNDAGPGSFRDQCAAAFANDSVVFNVSGIINLQSTVVIDKEIKIIGPTAKYMTINLNNGDIRFNTFTIDTIFISYLRFTKPTSNSNHFLVTNGAKVKFEYCVFDDMNTIVNGGAIEVNGANSKLIVNGCSFFGNTTQNNGGAIFANNDAECTIKNSTFNENNAASTGGCISLNATSTLIAVNNTFHNNNNGIIYAISPDCNIIITNNIFSSSAPTTMLLGTSIWNGLGGNVYTSTAGILGSTLTTLGINTSNDIFSGNQANLQLRPTHVTDGYGLKWFPVINSSGFSVETGVYSAYVTEFDGRRAPRTLDGNIDGVLNVDAGACEYTPYRVTSNSGAGDFESIFTLANSNTAGSIYIEFDCSPSGTHITSGLTTTYSGKWIIDGFTQFGSAVPGPSASITAVTPGQFPNVISGNSTLLSIVNAGFGTTISGLAFDNEFTTSIFINNTQSVNIFGNLFFSTAASNADKGVHVFGGNNHTIGGSFHLHRNVMNDHFASIGSAGILIEQSDKTKVIGNFIGTNANGTSSITNDDGVIIGFDASNTQVGGSELFQKNIISGNFNRGVGITVGASTNNIIESNYIGLNYAGTAALPNSIGISVEGNETKIGNFNKQSGNVISGNTYGIQVFSEFNEIHGNIIGLNPTTDASIPNTQYGISIESANNQVGFEYSNLAQRNVISGNGVVGIYINGINAVSNTIQGNLIGPYGDGISAPATNQNFGIHITNQAYENYIGSANLDNGNVVSGNGSIGIALSQDVNTISIQSNNIGVDKTETIDLPNGTVGIQLLNNCTSNIINNNMVARNGTNGIEINSSNNNTIFDNVIGCNRDVTANFGNTESGITLFNSFGTYIEENNIHSNGLFGIDMSGSNGTQIFTNFIGGNGSSTEPFIGSGNGDRGIYVDQSDSVQIGDGTFFRANYIKFNNGDGITIEGGCTLVQHTYNFISNNNGLGIDIDADGVSIVPTDNEGAQAPVFTGAADCSGTVTITGTLNGMPSTMYRLDFYKNTTPDASGSGEGETYIEKTYVITDGAGVTNFNHIFSEPVSVGDIITAIASDSINGFPIRNSSEFAVNIMVQSSPSITLVTSTNESCSGTMDGSIDVSVSGGIAPYTYTWYNSSAAIVGSNEDVSGLGADDYYLELEDAIGCIINSAVYNITSPPLFTVSVSTSEATCAGGSDGTATAVEVGGTGPFTYLWSPGGQTTQTINGLFQGSYDVTVTDANGCIQMNTGFVFEPSPMMLNFTTTDPTCFGSTDGLLSVNVSSGGTAPFNYLWSPGSFTTQTISGLSSGNYTCQVTDANGCIQSDNVSLTDPPQLILTQDAQTNVSCFGGIDGSATVGASGNAPFTYSWAPFGGTSATASGLNAQIFTVTVMDINGCTAQENFNISEPASITFNQSFTNESCAGTADGTISLEITSGGAPSFSFELFDDFDVSINSELSVGLNDLRTFSGLTGGDYYIVVTDLSGCDDTILYSIPQPFVYTASFSAPSFSCEGTIINFTDASSNTPTSWQWDFGDLNTSNLQNPSHTYSSAGVYTVTLTTFWGACSEVHTDNITINVTPVVTNSNTLTICSNDPISIPLSATVISTFTWTASYVALTGGSGSGSGDINEILQNITSNPEVAPYSVIPTSSLGCVGNPYIINVTVNPEPVYSGPTSYTICSGDALSINLTSPIASTWNWDATSNVNVGGESTTNQTTSSITDVLINSLSTPENVTYNVQPTSLLGCANSYQTITVTVNPTPATPTITSNSPICEGGTLTLTTPLVAGAAYVWSGPNGFSSNLQNPSIVGISSAGAGTYSLVNTLAGCNSSTGTSTVIVNVAPTISIADPGGIGQSICITSPTTSMSANTPIVGTGVWTYISGPSFPTIVNNTAPNTVINDLTAPGNYVFEWTISNGGCIPSSSQITVTVDNLPTVADAGIDQSVCEAVGTSSMNANTPIVGFGNWSQLSGPIASIVNVNSPTTVINGLTTPGSYVFEWTTINGGCPTTSDNVLITIESSPTTSNAGVNQNICASSSSTNLTANTPTIGTGLWSFVSGPGSPTIISPTNPNSLVVGLSTVGSYIFEWTISNGTCTPSTSQVTITTIANPVTPVVSSNSPLCEGDNILLSTPLVAGASYSWTGPGGFTSTLQNPTINSVTTSNAGTYSLDVTVNGCTSVNPGSTAVSINPTPTVSNAGTDQDVCINVATATMSANTAVFGVGTWSFVSGPISPSFVDINSPITNVNGMSNAGTYVFEWTISSIGCISSSDQVTIIVDNLPTAADAGLDTTACATIGTMTLFGNNPSFGTGTWSQIGGPATTITSPSNNITGITGLSTAGTYIYQWTIVNGTCVISTDQKVVTLNPGPSVSNAGSDQTICVSNPSVSMSANFPTEGSGLWTQISGPNTASFTNTMAPTSIVNDLNIAGSYVFEWTISSLGCTSSSSQVTINVDDVPTTANAGIDTTACETLGSMTFFGNNPTVGTGVWTQISGTGTTIASPTSNITSVSGLTTAGTYVYEWTISNGVCVSSSDQRMVVLSTGPTTATAGSDQSICVSNANVTMAANTPSNGTGAWSYISGPTTPSIINFSDPNTVVNNLNAAGSYIFEWAISSVGCTPSTSQVTINVDDVPTTANAGVDTTACETLGSMTFFGNSPIVGTGVWTQISGTGTTIASPTSNITSVSGLTTAGTYVYEWTISNGVCSSSSDQKIITLSSGPTIANAGAGQSICISTASATMAANSPSNGTGTWNYISGPTTPTIVTLSDPNTVVNNLNAAGSYIFEWAISSVGCTPSTSQVTINVDDVPTFSDAGLPQSICAGNDTVIMNANTPLIGSGSWMQISGGSTIIDNTSSPSTIITGFVTPGTYVYEWVIGNGSCSNSSDQVTITVEEAPTTSIAGTNQDICVSAAATTLAANSPIVGTGTWSFVSGPSVPTFVNINSPTTSANGFMMPGVYVLEWAISNGSCVPSTSQVTITVNDAPTTSAAGSDQTICSTAGTVSMNANSPFVGLGSWSQISGPSSIIVDLNSPTTVINGLTTAGVYNFQWEISNITCTSSTDVVTITVNEGPSVNATAPNNVCASESSFNVLGTQNNANSVIWSIVSGSGSLSSTTTNASVYTLGASDQSTTVILLFDGISSSCPLASDTVYVVIDPIPNAPTTTDNLNQSICEGTTVNLSASTTTSGANIFWFSNAGLTNQIGVGANVTLGPIVSNGNAYVVSSLNGCVNNNPLIFNLNLVSNSVDAGDSVSVCAGSSTTLNGAASGNFYWINEVGLSDTTILNPTVNPTVETYYYLVSNNGGCTAIDSVLVYIITDCETIQVTNSFSPNGDGVNDFFTIDGLNNSVALRVTIINRWGDVVADIPNYDNIISRWDGTYNGSPVPEGTYFYIIEYLEGSVPSTGWVQVLR